MCPTLLPEVDDLQEIRVMLADKVEMWAKAYIESWFDRAIDAKQLSGVFID